MGVTWGHFNMGTPERTIFLTFQKSKKDSLKEKMAGKARKSTHSKKASSKVLASRSKSKPAAPKKRVEINENKHYDVAEIGPVYLEWGKRVRVTKRGSLN